ADVTVRPAPDGMAQLAVDLPQPLATAIRDAVNGYARMAKADGDPRPIGQLRVGVLGDLVLRPWDASRPPFTAHLTVWASLDTLAAGAAGHEACAVGQAVPGVVAGGDTGTGAAAACGCGRTQPAQVDGQPITAAQLRALLEQLDALCPGGLQAPAGGSLTIALTDPGSGA
ncbi:hypothetical protein ACFSHS_14695, partial [Blastococcus deserti]